MANQCIKPWNIEYIHQQGQENLLEHWLDTLAYEQFKSVAKELKLLQAYGNQLALPHSRALGKKLFELRERRYGYRIYYSFSKDHIIMLYNAGDKSTQKSDIKLARERMKISSLDKV